MNDDRVAETSATPRTDDLQACRSIEWYSDGQSQIVEVDDVRITVRFVGRQGRRGRIAITAPAGAVFHGHLKQVRGATP